MLKKWIWLACFVAFQAAGESEPGSLTEFLADYSDVILHAAPAPEEAESDDVRIDFWKRMRTEERDTEAVEYLRNRGLFEEVDGGRVFFLRLLTEQEMSEVLQFKTEIRDPSLREALDTRFFRFALVRMVGIDAGGRIDPEPLGLAEEPVTSVETLRAHVVGHLERRAETVEPLPEEE